MQVPWDDCFDVMVINRGADRSGHVACAAPLTFVEGAPGEVRAPTMRLQYDQAQGLMDELWRAGLRPKEGTGSAGALKATENHLADMRKLALDLVAHKIGQTP